MASCMTWRVLVSTPGVPGPACVGGAGRDVPTSCEGARAGRRQHGRPAVGTAGGCGTPAAGCRLWR